MKSHIKEEAPEKEQCFWDMLFERVFCVYTIEDKVHDDKVGAKGSAAFSLRNATNRMTIHVSFIWANTNVSCLSLQLASLSQSLPLGDHPLLYIYIIITKIGHIGLHLYIKLVFMGQVWHPLYFSPKKYSIFSVHNTNLTTSIHLGEWIIWKHKQFLIRYWSQII